MCSAYCSWVVYVTLSLLCSWWWAFEDTPWLVLKQMMAFMISCFMGLYNVKAFSHLFYILKSLIEKLIVRPLMYVVCPWLLFVLKVAFTFIVIWLTSKKSKVAKWNFQLEAVPTSLLHCSGYPLLLLHIGSSRWIMTLPDNWDNFQGSFG